MSSRLNAYLRLMRFHRPWPILLILFPTYWGLFLGPNLPSVKEWLVFTLGAIFARAGGCVINDYFDRNIDGRVERTKSRPLQGRLVHPWEAIMLFSCLMFLSFLCLLFLRMDVILLGFIAFFLCLTYPLAKRITYFPQVVLGAAFNFGLVMAYLQVNGHLSALAWVYYFFSILWTVHYDTLYALTDYEDDLKIGVKSIATFFQDRIFNFLLWTSVTLIIFIFAIWTTQGLSVIRAFILLALMVFLGVQYSLLISKSRKAGLMLFNQHVGIGIFVLLGIVC